MAVEVVDTRVALFGGSFNPPHQGHVLAAVHVLSAGLVDKVLVVPVYEHALSKRLVPYAERLGMVRAAFGWLPHVEVSAIEEKLGAPSRTLSTLKALGREHPNWAMRLMVGSDILGELSRWHAFDEIELLAPPLVLARAGDGNAGEGHCALPEVSSTEIRQLLMTRGSLAREVDNNRPFGERLRELVPATVLQWIDRHQLYHPESEQ